MFPEEKPKTLEEMKVMLEDLRKEYINAGGIKKEIIKRQARALKIAMGEA